MAYPSATVAPDHAALLGHTIDKNRLQFVSVLGLGAYGVVYLARDVSAEIGASSTTDPTSPYSGSGYYAVKCLNKSGLDSRQKSFQRREIALHTLASTHPNIVSLHRVVETSSIIYVILSYCPDGDLFSMITEQSRYLGSDHLITSVFLQIVDAVEYCHKLGIYHRDLKPENILCCDGGSRVLLADFGLATTEKTSKDFGCGSTFYMSPECQGGIYERLGYYSTMHNDVWSLGVILVNLTCGRNPWKQACPSDETFRAYLENPDFLRSILPISAECNDLLQRIFALNVHDRINISEVRQAVLRIQRWTMTEDELEHATRATKEAAKSLPARQSSVDNVSTFVDSDSSSSTSNDSSAFTDYSFAATLAFPALDGPNQGSSADYAGHFASRPLPPVPQQHHSAPKSMMDIDPPEDSSCTPILGTPKATRARPVFRRRRASSGASEPSSASSSSSGESWSDLPPTPDTPTFLRHMQQKARPEIDITSAIERMESIASVASSKASYEQLYPEYMQWVEGTSPPAVVLPSKRCDAHQSLSQLLEVHSQSRRTAART